MAFFVWHRTLFPRFLARLNGRAPRTFSQRTLFSVCVSGLTKIQAEDLLDWLEATGRRWQKLAHSEGQGFSVSYNEYRTARPVQLNCATRGWDKA